MDRENLVNWWQKGGKGRSFVNIKACDAIENALESHNVSGGMYEMRNGDVR